MKLGLTIILALVCFANQGNAIDLATYRGSAVTDQEFKDELASLGEQADVLRDTPEIRRKFLEHIVDSEIFAKEAVKQKLDQSLAFRQRMELARREILANLFVEGQIAKATEAGNLKKYFASHADKFSQKEIRASHILFDEGQKKLAEQVLKRAQNGEDFAALAKQYSTCPTGPKGGDLGFFKHGQMVPAFDAVAFATPKGQINPALVQTRFGWHIIKVSDVRGEDVANFDSVAAEVKRKRASDFKDELQDELRRSYDVRINDDALHELKL